MPVYLDSHTRPLSRKSKSRPRNTSKNRRKITVLEIIRVRENKCYCLLEAPDPESVEQFHLRDGIRCDWIEQVTSINEITVESSPGGLT
jgi:hypothetical protein